jgi:hypothetical protein
VVADRVHEILGGGRRRAARGCDREQREVLARDDLSGRDGGDVGQRAEGLDGGVRGGLRVVALVDLRNDGELAVETDADALGDEVVGLALRGVGVLRAVVGQPEANVERRYREIRSASTTTLEAMTGRRITTDTQRAPMNGPR